MTSREKLSEKGEQKRKGETIPFCSPLLFFLRTTSIYVVYIGHHGDKTAEIADIILPAPSFTEKNATYVNLEGRVQNSYAAVDPAGQAKVDWEIILDLAKLSGFALPYSNLAEIRARMAKTNPIFEHIDHISRYTMTSNTSRQKEFSSDVFDVPTENYYLTNSICRSSRTMQKCAELISKDTKIS